MPGKHAERIRAIFESAAAAHQRFAAENALRVAEAATAILSALSAGHKVLAFGNGGSAGDAQHLVTELVVRFEDDRRALPAIALTADTSVMTAAANDYGYERVFARQIEALGVSGDVAIGISTSGRSKNVETALSTARARGLTTIALTGNDGGPVGAAAAIHVNVADSSTARVQEVHRTVLHAICALVERGLVPGTQAG
jgi:D-sedoheptulose 7-phosphate isomerase